MKKSFHRIIFLFVLLIFSFPFVFANADVPTVKDSFFIENYTLFDKGYNIYSRNLNTGLFMPLTSDLDGDGLTEILIWDNKYIKIFQEKTLQLKGSINTNMKGEPYIWLDDYNGDSLNEIFVVTSLNNSLRIFDYNASGIFLNRTISFGVYATSDSKLGACNNHGTCFFTYQQGSNLFLKTFRNDQIGNANISLHSIGNTYCSPRIANVNVVDGNFDGRDEFVFSMIEDQGAGLWRTHVFYVDVLDNMTPRMLNQLDVATTASGVNCSTYSGVYGSPNGASSGVLVGDFDGVLSNGYEFVLANKASANQWDTKSYSLSSMAFIDDYPEVLYADGIFVSNPVPVVNAFDGSTLDFCTLGYKNTLFYLSCGSIQTSEIFQTKDFDLTALDGIYNLSKIGSGAKRYSTAIHSVQGDSVSDSEILTSYGIYKPDFNSCDFLSFCNIDRILEIPQRNCTLIAADVERNGRNDLLCLKGDIIYYLDDKFSLLPSYVSYYSINPCISSTWKVNTSVYIDVKAIDPQGSSVNVSATIYNNLPYNQTSGWVVIPSNSLQNFVFKANKTVGTATLVLKAKGMTNKALSSQTLSFSVNSVGIDSTDGCTTTFSNITGSNVTATNFSLTPTETEKETIKNILTGGGSLSLTLVALLILILIVVGTISLISLKFNIKEPSVLLGITAIMLCIGWIGMVMYGILPAWTVIFFIIFALFIISVVMVFKFWQ
jgi:hypothetical protein